MEVIFRSAIFDNQDHWQLFEDDSHIIDFLQNNLNERDEREDSRVDMKKEISMGKSFDWDDRCKIKEKIGMAPNIIEINLGTNSNPQLIKVGKVTSKSVESS